jgi:hypothetical protein
MNHRAANLRECQSDRLAALGVDVTSVLARARLARSRFEGGKARVSTAEFFALWKAVADLNVAPDLGLRIGSEAPPHQQHVASLAALHSPPNLGEALRKLSRYARLVCPEEGRLDVKRGEARLSVAWLFAEHEPPGLLIDVVFAKLMKLARRGTNKPIVARRVELARRASNAEMLRKHFGGELRFNAPNDVLVLDAQTLDEPSRTIQISSRC